MSPLALLLLASLQASPPVHDCNGNGIEDAEDIAAGTSCDENKNGIPDECEEFAEGSVPARASRPWISIPAPRVGALARIGLEFRGPS